jgi:hypothetical protein
MILDLFTHTEITPPFLPSQSILTTKHLLCFLRISSLPFFIRLGVFTVLILFGVSTATSVHLFSCDLFPLADIFAYLPLN